MNPRSHAPVRRADRWLPVGLLAAIVLTPVALICRAVSLVGPENLSSGRFWLVDVDAGLPVAGWCGLTWTLSAVYLALQARRIRLQGDWSFASAAGVWTIAVLLVGLPLYAVIQGA